MDRTIRNKRFNHRTLFIYSQVCHIDYARAWSSFGDGCIHWRSWVSSGLDLFMSYSVAVSLWSRGCLSEHGGSLSPLHLHTYCRSAPLERDSDKVSSLPCPECFLSQLYIHTPMPILDQRSTCSHISYLQQSSVQEAGVLCPRGHLGPYPHLARYVFSPQTTEFQVAMDCGRLTSSQTRKVLDDNWSSSCNRRACPCVENNNDIT